MEMFLCCFEVILSRVTVYKFHCVVNISVCNGRLLCVTKDVYCRGARSLVGFKWLKERSDELPADLVVLAAFKRGVWVNRSTAVLC